MPGIHAIVPELHIYLPMNIVYTKRNFIHIDKTTKNLYYIIMVQNINIRFIEHIQCGRDWKWNSDDNGWKGYHIWCIDGGGAWVKTNGQEHHLLPGDTFLFNFNQNHICTHDPENPLRVTTAYFQCETEETESRVFRQEKFLAEALHRALYWEEQGRKEMSHRWAHTAIHEMFELQENKQPIPYQVEKACEIMDQIFPTSLSLAELAQKVGYSPNQLIRLFKKSMNTTPVQYEIRKKMEYAKGMLLYSNESIAEISDKAGYTDIAYFSKMFKKQTGYSPSEYRKIIREK